MADFSIGSFPKGHHLNPAARMVWPDRARPGAEKSTVHPHAHAVAALTERERGSSQAGSPHRQAQPSRRGATRPSLRCTGCCGIWFERRESTRPALKTPAASLVRTPVARRVSGRLRDPHGARRTTPRARRREQAASRHHRRLRRAGAGHRGPRHRPELVGAAAPHGTGQPRARTRSGRAPWTPPTWWARRAPGWRIAPARSADATRGPAKRRRTRHHPVARDGRRARRTGARALDGPTARRPHRRARAHAPAAHRVRWHAEAFDRSCAFPPEIGCGWSRSNARKATCPEGSRCGGAQVPTASGEPAAHASGRTGGLGR